MSRQQGQSNPAETSPNRQKRQTEPYQRGEEYEPGEVGAGYEQGEEGEENEWEGEARKQKTGMGYLDKRTKRGRQKGLKYHL